MITLHYYNNFIQILRIYSCIYNLLFSINNYQTEPYRPVTF